MKQVGNAFVSDPLLWVHSVLAAREARCPHRAAFQASGGTLPYASLIPSSPSITARPLAANSAQWVDNHRKDAKAALIPGINQK